MKIRQVAGWVVIAGLIVAATGCATRFSSRTIHDEIVAQSGQDPLGVFEMNIGRFTTMMVKKFLAGDDGELPLAGLEQLEIAVFDAASDSGPVIDVTRIKVRGWEPVVRTYKETYSAMLLFRRAW